MIQEMFVIQGVHEKSQREILHEVHLRYRYLNWLAERLIWIQEEKMIQAYRILDERMHSRQQELLRAERRLSLNSAPETTSRRSPEGSAPKSRTLT